MLLLHAAVPAGAQKPTHEDDCHVHVIMPALVHRGAALLAHALGDVAARSTSDTRQLRLTSGAGTPLLLLVMRAHLMLSAAAIW